MADIEPSVLREKGKLRYFREGADADERDTGLQMLAQAGDQGDPEASYIVGMLMLRGRVRPVSGDRIETAMSILSRASSQGSLQARSFLNQLCAGRYRRDVTDKLPPAAEGPLTGFDGKPIHIDRKGVFTPVDAKLEYVGGENVLTFQANVYFGYMLDDERMDTDLFERAVLRGFQAWAGRYEVFGGQRLTVKVELTAEDRLTDSVIVLPITGDAEGAILGYSDKMLPEKLRRLVRGQMESKRSFASVGMRRWSVHSMKTVWMQGDDRRFRDEDYIFNVAKHEFGHVLGLGDLYACEEDGLAGVEHGTYGDIDSFHLYGREYGLVMCDQNAPVGNNDIEMVVLAFSENKFQRFQPDKRGVDISTALGQGN